MSISRRLPNSNEAAWLALDRAKQKNESTPTDGNFLTVTTANRLDDAHTATTALRQLLIASKADSAKATVAKNAALAKMRLLNSQYIQVLNMYIDAGTFPTSYRACFKIAVNSGAVPDQQTEDDIQQLGLNIIEGAPAMIAQGGTALPYPALADLTAAYTALVAAQQDQSNKIDQATKDEENLSAQTEKNKKVILKVWDEVETFYNEEEIESKRANAREWGVVYMNNASLATVQLRVVQTVNNVSSPISGVTALIAETNETATSGTDGIIKIESGGSGSATLTLNGTGLQTKEIGITITAGGTTDLGDVEMVGS